MADINDYLDGLNYKLSAEEKQLMDILAECWEHCNKGDCHNCEYRSGNEWCKMLLCMSYQYAKRLIAAGYSKRLLPAADVAPVVHGRMKKSGEYTVERYQYKIVEEKCSVCEHYSIRFKHKSESNFCSRCGAKMDGEVNYDD